MSKDNSDWVIGCWISLIFELGKVFLCLWLYNHFGWTIFLKIPLYIIAFGCLLVGLGRLKDYLFKNKEEDDEDDAVVEAEAEEQIEEGSSEVPTTESENGGDDSGDDGDDN